MRVHSHLATSTAITCARARLVSAKGKTLGSTICGILGDWAARAFKAPHAPRPPLHARAPAKGAPAARPHFVMEAQQPTLELSTELKPGKVVAGFRLGKQIGFGGFAKVFTAEHVDTRRKAAVKCVRKPKMKTRTSDRCVFSLCLSSGLSLDCFWCHVPSWAPHPATSDSFPPRVRCSREVTNT